jgi:DNA-binding MarR family transcriptional regulator
LYDSYLKKAGIRVTQYVLLKYIEIANGPTIGELGDALCLEQSTVTRNIEVLRENGYIFADHSKNDRRKKFLSLTELGRDKLNEASALWLEAQARVRKELGDEETELLRSALKNAANLKREFENEERILG